MGVVYKITSPSGKIYIGKSIHFYNRIANYKALNCKFQIKLYNSFIKYGFDNHKIEIIFESLCELELIRMEIIFIEEFNSYKIGLNMTKGGEGFSGRKHTEKTKDLIRSQKIGLKHSQESKDKISVSNIGRKVYGKKLTDLHKKNISLGNMGKVMGKMSTETKNKISNTKKGMPSWNKGIKLSFDHLSKVLFHNAKKRKSIYQVDLNGKIINEFKSITDAAKELNISNGNISNVLTKKIKHTKGYIFIYK